MARLDAVVAMVTLPVTLVEAEPMVAAFIAVWLSVVPSKKLLYWAKVSIHAEVEPLSYEKAYR